MSKRIAITVEAWNLISQTLADLPYRIAKPIVDQIEASKPVEVEINDEPPKDDKDTDHA